MCGGRSVEGKISVFPKWNCATANKKSARRVEGWPLTAFRSNRHIPLLEFSLSLSKSTTYEFLIVTHRPFSDSLPCLACDRSFTGRGTQVAGRRCSPAAVAANRTRQRLEFAVSHTKQRTDAISNRTFLHVLHLRSLLPRLARPLPPAPFATVPKPSLWPVTHYPPPQLPYFRGRRLP